MARVSQLVLATRELQVLKATRESHMLSTIQLSVLLYH